MATDGTIAWRMIEASGDRWLELEEFHGNLYFLGQLTCFIARCHEMAES